MGHSSSSSADYTARSAYRSAVNTVASDKPFAYSGTMHSTPVKDRKIHESLDPKRLNTLGEKIRECVDSDAHPVTLPVFIGLDETGSMGDAAYTVQKKLATVKGAMLRAGLEDAQICFGAYGDASFDEVAPCQVGQFESGIETEDWLNNIYIEHMGGGNRGESSGLLLYFLGQHSRLDSVDKRGKKGYLILTGDECPLKKTTAAQIKRYIGDDVQGDLSIEEIVEDAKKLYDIYFFLVQNGAAKAQGSLEVWAKLLGAENVIPVQDIDTISEQISLLIAHGEGVADTIDEGIDLLLAEGVDAKVASAAGKAMVPFYDRAVTTNAEGVLPEATAGGGAKRI